MDEVELFSYSNDRIAIHVRAFIEDGKLNIAGHDLGKAPKDAWGEDEYEYFYSLSKEDTDRIHEKLKCDTKSYTGLLELIRMNFSGIDGCKKFREYCEGNSITCNFFSCF